MSGLLKFITCGSVDDGKSTLIGHLLYDAKLLYADQEQALELDSKVGSRGGAIDYSLLLDGLIAEREQGITIDVAYRYFTTDNRSFICADTPGHEEYTRNMACGASFADLAVILIDATKGVLVQTRRHARICALMGIRYFVFAVNKMDLVGYDENRFREISAQVEELRKELDLQNLILIPVSATEGDNITAPTASFSWYHGPTLLHYLETVDVAEASADEKGFYLPVQRVCRPDRSFRGFQGQIEHGTIRVGDPVRSLPSGEEAHVRRILTAGRDVQEAAKGQPVTLQLDREVDVSRGCVLERGSGLTVSDAFQTELLWMDDVPLTVGKNFLVKLGTKQIPGIVTKIDFRIDVNSGAREQTDHLGKNEIAVCEIAVTEPIVMDRFAAHRTMGELILIDRISHMTSACGVVLKTAGSGPKSHPRADRQMRAALNWQTPAVFTFRPGEDGSTAEAIEEAEFRLVRNGRHTYLLRPEAGESYAATVRALRDAGLVVLLVLDKEAAEDGGLSPEENVRSWSTVWKEDREAAPQDISSRIFSLTSANLTMDSNNWVI
ncbi:MAG: GTP-binding protein [Clostridiales bacterium]|nr:GTP-binding protein [Clostridiales bacterium]